VLINLFITQKILFPALAEMKSRTIMCGAIFDCGFESESKFVFFTCTDPVYQQLAQSIICVMGVCHMYQSVMYHGAYSLRSRERAQCLLPIGWSAAPPPPMHLSALLQCTTMGVSALATTSCVLSQLLSWRSMTQKGNETVGISILMELRIRVRHEVCITVRGSIDGRWRLGLLQDEYTRDRIHDA